MNIKQASQLIQQATQQMNLDYGGCLFDEWAIVKAEQGNATVLDYFGPRKDVFPTRLTNDMAALNRNFRESVALEHGDYDFARNATGSQIDAAVCVGQCQFLLFNNLTVAMADICKNVRWLAAQKTFFSLCERFRSDPLAV